MHGIKIKTDLSANRTYVMARKAARKLDFSIEDSGERSFVATKGSSWLSFLVGSFNVYCAFKISVEDYGPVAQFILERNNPKGSSGSIGVARVKSRAKEFANEMITEILAAGAKVLDEKEF